MSYERPGDLFREVLKQHTKKQKNQQKKSNSDLAQEMFGMKPDVIIPKQKTKYKPRYTGEERARKIAELRAKRDGVDLNEEIEQIPEIDHIEEINTIDPLPQIPDGFPDGTAMNDDGTLTLPDGRMVRKIVQEVEDEPVQTA